MHTSVARPADPPPAQPTRWRRALYVLLGLTALIGLAAWAVRKVGQLQFAREAARAEALLPRPSESALPVAEADDASVRLAELVELESSGRIDFSPRSASEEGLAPQAAVREILGLPAPSQAAWNVVELHLAELGAAFELVDRMQERSRWSHGRSTEELLVHLLNLRQLDAALPWISAAAVHAARAGDLALAERRLRQAFHLSAAARDLPDLAAFQLFARQRCQAFEGLAAVLRLHPDALDPVWLGSVIEEPDLRARHARAMAGDFHGFLDELRAQTPNEAIKRALWAALFAGDGQDVDLPSGKGLRLTALLGGLDAAHFARLSAELQALTQGSLAEATKRTSNLKRHWGAAPWFAPTAQFLAAQLANGIPAWLELESHLVLARIVLADRIRGRAAALELLERTLDPGDDQPVGQRAEQDGTLTLWCVGSDLLDLGGSALEDDIVWSLPARR